MSDQQPSAISRILQLFEEKGDSEYGGEAVTQLEHALQCAQLAEQNGGNQSLVVASLLHDIGHLLHELPDDAPDQGIDDAHEKSGYHFLRKYFLDEVCEPVRLHVPAKRYLCTTDPTYFATLSPPSVLSLELQGGQMDSGELEAFRSNPFYEDALKLRRWDDEAKVVGLETPDVNHYAPEMTACLKEQDHR